MIDGKSHRQPAAMALVSEGSRKMAAAQALPMKFENYSDEKAALVQELHQIESQLGDTKAQLGALKAKSFAERWSERTYIRLSQPINQKRNTLSRRKSEIVIRIGEIRDFAVREKRSINNGVVRDDGTIDLVALTIEVRDSLTRIESYLLAMTKKSQPS